VPPFGGVLYPEATEEALMEAILRFEDLEKQIVPKSLQTWATRFSEREFARKMAAILRLPAQYSGHHVHATHLQEDFHPLTHRAY